jgi:hypothetical protein
MLICETLIVGPAGQSVNRVWVAVISGTLAPACLDIRVLDSGSPATGDRQTDGPDEQSE